MDRNLRKLQEMVKDREAGMLQFTGSQTVRHDLVTEQQQTAFLARTLIMWFKQVFLSPTSLVLPGPIPQHAYRLLTYQRSQGTCHFPWSLAAEEGCWCMPNGPNHIRIFVGLAPPGAPTLLEEELDTGWVCRRCSRTAGLKFWLQFLLASASTLHFPFKKYGCPHPL